MKKICYYVFTFYLLTLITSITASEDISDAIELPEPESELADIAAPSSQEEIAPVVKDPNDCKLSPETIVSILAGVQEKGDILRLLQQNFYLKTNPLHVRSILDLPSMQPYYIDYCGWYLGGQLFYNQTTRGIFTGNIPVIKCYADLEDSALADELDNILEDIKKLGLLDIDIDVVNTLSLFKNIRIQERRLGVLGAIYTQTPDYQLRLQVPFFYHEHNFFLNQSEADQIKNAPFFTLDPDNIDPGTSQEIEQFFRKNLVNDRYGLGDTRLVALFSVYKNPCFNTQIGFQATLPTAVDYEVGIFGSKFSNNPCQPRFKIEDIINLFQCNRADKANELVIDFGKDAIRRLSSLLLNVPLGNGGFVGFGPQAQIKNFFGDLLTLHTEATVEFFFPRSRYRFFLNGKNPADFNINLADESKAVQNLAFINQQLVNTFFPLPLRVDVRPGTLFKAKQALYYGNEHLRLGIGLDFWFQGEESLGIDKCPYFNLTPEAIRNATKTSAYQLKIFNHVGYFTTTDCYDWHITFASDATVASSGIGQDFTVGLRVGFNF